MRFMIIVKATKDSEAGVMPDDKMFATMAEYHEQLAKARMLVDASGLQASSKNWRTSISPSFPPSAGLGKRFVHSSASARDFASMMV